MSEKTKEVKKFKILYIVKVYMVKLSMNINQEGGLRRLWYMENWNHMPHRPCIHEYF